MSRKQFLEKISANWVPLVICFVASCFIYFFHQIATLEKRTFTVPLTIKNEGSMVPSGNEKYRYVKVTIRGKAEQIATISEKDLQVYVDITNQTKSGKFDFPVLVSPDERLFVMEPLEIVTKPDTVSLTVEPKITRYVSVSPSVAGTPEHGFKQIDVSVEPEYVAVTGPESMVESLEYIQTAMVSVEGAKTDVTKTVGFINNNSTISIDRKASFNVQVSISPEGMIKNYNGITVDYVNLLDDIEIVSDPIKIDVVLEGELLTLEKLDSSFIKAEIDCTELVDEGDYDFKIKVSVPAGVRVTGQSVHSVKITAVKKVFEEEPQAQMESEV